MAIRKWNCTLRLPPIKREDIFSVQEAKQLSGWQITSFNLPEAWKLTQGEGVTIASIDSGCDLDHPDLKDNILKGGINYINGKAPQDDMGHGSHTIGTICALNNDIGMVGVAPKAKVIPFKVLDKRGIGNLNNTCKAIKDAADLGVDLIVMSLGSPSPVPAARKAMQYAEKKGCVIFCAAGNAGKTRQIFYPAAYPEAIGIGSIDENFKRANFSCTGPDLDLLAPGVKIFSTVPDNWYALMSGTSMANPWVAGVAALLLSHRRKQNPNIKLTKDDYLNYFKKNTIPSKDYGGQHLFEGFGILDPRKFEEWATT